MIKKAFALILLVIIAASLLSSCKFPGIKDGDKLSIVTTNFPPYDFAKNIAKDKADVSMLLSPGKESHTYDPSPADILKIQNCDIFICTGGESDEWVDTILEAAGGKMTVIKMMDEVTLYTEEIAEGMDGESDGEYDEHVWTSPKNAEKIVSAIEEALKKASPDDSEYFAANAKAYIEELEILDRDIRAVTDNAERKLIVMADRFPIRYFTEEYGLSYCAAFPGCSSKTEPSPRTTAYIINKVKEEKIPVIFKIELSDGYVAEAISEATGAKIMTFYSLHNISKDDFDSHESYISLMRKNITSLKAALG